MMSVTIEPYEPSASVSLFASMSGDIEMDLGDTNYYIAVLGPSIVFGALGLVSLVIFLICMLFRCCCKCCRCEPGKNVETYEINESGARKPKKDVVLFGIFFLFILGAIVADQMIFIATTQLQTGVSTASESIGDLSTMMTGAMNAGLNMYAAGVKMAKMADYAKTESEFKRCGMDLTGVAAGAIQTYASVIYNLVKDVPALLDETSVVVETYTNSYLLVFMMTVYAITMVNMLFFALFTFIGIATLMRISVVVAWIVCLIATLVLTFDFAFLMVVGNVCVSAPGQSLIDGLRLSKGEAFYDMLNSYTLGNCDGTDIIANSVSFLNEAITNATKALDDGIASVNALNIPFTPNCLVDPEYVKFQGYLSTVILENANIGIQMGCPKIHGVWDKMVHSALCTEMFEGASSFFWSQAICNLLLFLVMCTATVVWQYFHVRDTSVIPGDDDYEDGYVQDAESAELIKGEDGEFEKGNELPAAALGGDTIEGEEFSPVQEEDGFEMT